MAGPKDWALWPPAAEAHLEDACAAMMGPFAPVDRAALSAAPDR